MSSLMQILSNSFGLTPPTAPPTLDVPRLSSDVTDEEKAKNFLRRAIVVWLNTTLSGRVTTCILYP